MQGFFRDLRTVASDSSAGHWRLVQRPFLRLLTPAAVATSRPAANDKRNGPRRTIVHAPQDCLWATANYCLRASRIQPHQPWCGSLCASTYGCDEHVLNGDVICGPPQGHQTSSRATAASPMTLPPASTGEEIHFIDWATRSGEARVPVSVLSPLPPPSFESNVESMIHAAGDEGKWFKGEPVAGIASVLSPPPPPIF